MPGLFDAYPLDSGVDALPSDGCAIIYWRPLRPGLRL
jgi:hypothetical protein